MQANTHIVESACVHAVYRLNEYQNDQINKQENNHLETIPYHCTIIFNCYNRAVSNINQCGTLIN